MLTAAEVVKILGAPLLKILTLLPYKSKAISKTRKYIYLQWNNNTKQIKCVWNYVLWYYGAWNRSNFEVLYYHSFKGFFEMHVLENAKF